jgi:hypothetical protein
MTVDAHANLAISTVAVAPSPATSGTSLTVATGHGTRFPAPPFNATVQAAGALADPTNAEIVRVTAIVGDVLTVVRAQEGTTARAIGVGDLLYAAITAKAFTDIEALLSPGPVFGADYLEGTEIADPDAPAADNARLYVRDNGAGLSQLVVRFPTGAVQVLATEPATAPPNDLPNVSGLVAWFKADALSLTDADPVATWADSSGEANDLAQATGGLQPTYRTNVLNGLPVVRFDGVDDYLTRATPTYAQPNTVFVVQQFAAPTDGAYNIMFDGAGGSGHYITKVGGGDSRALFAGATLAGSPATGNFEIWSASFNGALSELFVNGTSNIAGDAGSQSLVGLRVGAAFNAAGPFHGDIAEVLVYNAALSAGDRQLLEAYLGTKYDIAVA